MRRIQESAGLAEALPDACTHIFSLGFEERCLAYPRELSGRELSIRHKFYALDPGDERVNLALREQRERYWREMLRMFPSLIRGKEDGLGEFLENELESRVVLDVSCLPRTAISSVLSVIASKAQILRRFFVVYSYPHSYPRGPMQEPGSEIRLSHTSPRPGRYRSSLLVIPGFERSFTDAGIAWLSAAAGEVPEVSLLLPFPGREFHFFERAVESHRDLIRDSRLQFVYLDHLVRSQKLIHDYCATLSSGQAVPVFVLVTGPRVLVVAADLAVRRLRRGGELANLLFSVTRSHSSDRPGGCGECLVEEIPVTLLDQGQRVGTGQRSR